MQFLRARVFLLFFLAILCHGWAYAITETAQVSSHETADACAKLLTTIDVDEEKEVFQPLINAFKNKQPLILSELQKGLLYRSAKNLISSSLDYSKLVEHADPQASALVTSVRTRLEEMNGIAETLFISKNHETTYLQMMNYFSKLVRLVDVIAYKTEGNNFSGFFRDGEPYHSEYKSQPQKTIQLQDFSNTEADEFWKENDNETEWLKLKGLLIPMYGDMTIIDFNRLVGTGIIPLGLIEKTVTVDGTRIGPYQFPIHDMQHGARAIPGILSPHNLSIWNQLLDWADKEEGHIRLIRHTLLYLTSHEDEFFKEFFLGETPAKSFDGKIENMARAFNSAFTRLGRLPRENYWGVSELVKVSDDEIYNEGILLYEKCKNIFLTSQRDSGI